jgi:hypothetical protein
MVGFERPRAGALASESSAEPTGASVSHGFHSLPSGSHLPEDWLLINGDPH